MSLLNDMLRDLSLIQKNSDGINNAQANGLDFAAHEQRELLQQSSVVKPIRGTLLPSIFVFIVVVLLLLAWKEGFWLPHTGSAINTDEHVVSVTAQPLTADQSSSPEQKSVAINDAASPDPSPVVMEPAIAANQSADVLGERLAALESALARLSTAVEKSTAIEEANVAISYVAAETPVSLELQAQADNASENEYIEENESESIQDPFINSRNVNTEGVNAGDISAGESLVQTKVAQAANEIPADAHLSISPNPIAVDQRHVEQARQLLRQGQEPAAIVGLQTFIASAKSPRESTKLLLEIFNAQGNFLAMEKLLATANYLPSTDNYFYTAKIAIAQQREADAIQLLEMHLTEANEQENYLALLAGLYQRAEKFQEAATLYRRLLTSVGDKPAYWLGFALAQDSLNQPQTAKQAYLRLANYPDLQPQVRSYIQQRLATLQ